MELTRLTVTDAQRKSVALEYCQAIDNGSKTSPVRTAREERRLKENEGNSQFV